MKSDYRRIVVKIGSRLLTREDGSLDAGGIERLAADLTELRRAGLEIVLVSSGAIAAGVGRLGLKQRPSALAEKQAAAAVGQVGLMDAYKDAFNRGGIIVAQVLLTRADLEDQARYLNARNTLLTLLRMGVLPIVNENDTVVVEEIRVGDNDTLAAVVASKVEAQLLIILTDVEGLHSRQPRHGPGELLRCVEEITPEIEKLAGRAGSAAGTGGMATKILAARIATASGVAMAIASGRKGGVLQRLARGEAEGTFFPPQERSLGSRKRWIAFGARVKGRIQVDAGAVVALRERGKSLLASGVIRVEGHFRVGDTVAVCDEKNREFARGLSGFSASDLEKIKGLRSDKAQEVLGVTGTVEEVVHRDNLTFL